MRGRSIVMATAIAFAVVSCSTSAGVSTLEINAISSTQTPGTSSPDTPDTSAPDTISWGPCEGRLSVGIDLQCGALSVPLDYAAPDGRTISIEVARVPTVNSSERIGSLVMNPGGPGASGIEFLQSAALLMPKSISNRFDLVSFDPRGVGASTAVDCAVARDDNVSLLAAGDDAGWDALVKEAEANPSTCTSDTIAIGSWLGTNNAARDLDQIRAALGDEQLTYVGFSYGTRLGATYADLFADRVRALVLDGAVKPTTDFAELDADQAASIDKAFERFAAACDADTDCLVTQIGPTLDVYRSLVTSIAVTATLPTDDSARVLTPGELQMGVIAAMYNTQLWSVLSQGLYDASAKGDGTVLQVLADMYLGRQPDGTYDNSQQAGFTINCADNFVRPPVPAVRTESDDAASQSRWFGDFLRASTGCIGGPAPVDPLIVGHADGAPPILVIGNTGDPATPYEWSVAMADFLTSGQLYTVETDGHTAFLSVACVEPVVLAYLVDLTMPAPGAKCTNDSETDLFPPAGQGEFDKVIALFDCLRKNGADVAEVTLGDLLADPTGQALFDAVDPTDPAFATAALACKDLIEGL